MSSCGKSVCCNKQEINFQKERYRIIRKKKYNTPEVTLKSHRVQRELKVQETIQNKLSWNHATSEFQMTDINGKKRYADLYNSETGILTFDIPIQENVSDFEVGKLAGKLSILLAMFTTSCSCVGNIIKAAGQMAAGNNQDQHLLQSKISDDTKMYSSIN